MYHLLDHLVGHVGSLGQQLALVAAVLCLTGLLCVVVLVYWLWQLRVVLV